MCLSIGNMGVHMGAAHVMFHPNITLLDVSPTLIFRVRSVLELLSWRPFIGNSLIEAVRHVRSDRRTNVRFGPSFGGFLGAGLTGNPEHGIVRLGYLKLPERHENPKQNPAGVLYVGFVPALLDCVACNKERLGNLSFRARLLLCAFHVDNKSFRIVISCRDDYFILDGSEIAMVSAYARVA